jgi:2'-5' RNA ligase
VPPENWHVTLRFLGQADPAEVRARLDGTAFPAATAKLGPAVRRLGRGLVVAPVGGLDELAATVVEVTGDVGQPVDGRAFGGHVTLARVRGRARCPLVGTPIHAVAGVGEIVLARSHLRSTGAEYEAITRWPAG